MLSVVLIGKVQRLEAVEVEECFISGLGTVFVGDIRLKGRVFV